MDKLQLPEGVELSYTDKAAHVTTNNALMRYLRQKGNGSMPLTRTILAEYQIERGAPLKITERSMATELLIHAYLDGVFAGWVRFPTAMDCSACCLAAEREEIRMQTLTKKQYLALKAPSEGDFLAARERLLAALPEDCQLTLPAMQSLYPVLHAADYRVTVTLCPGPRGTDVVRVEPGDTTGQLAGACLDIGSTTMQLELVDLVSGRSSLHQQPDAVRHEYSGSHSGRQGEPGASFCIAGADARGYPRNAGYLLSKSGALAGGHLGHDGRRQHDDDALFPRLRPVAGVSESVCAGVL